MKIENPAALRFIINDDLYLLNSDKIAPPAPAVQSAPQPPVEVQQPIVNQTPVIAEPPVVIQTQPETPVIDFKYKGDNKKNFLVLVNYSSVDFMVEAHLAALENILRRKDLVLDDIAIVNLAKYPGQAKKDLLEFFKPEHLLIMGKDALPVDFTAPALNQVSQTGSIKTLYSFSFSEMMDSNDHKKIFWEQMKAF